MSTLQELLEQQAKLAEQIAELQKTQRADAISAALKLIQENALTVADLFPNVTTTVKTRAPRGTAQPKSKGEPKYRSSIDPNLTWSGKGRKPEWVITFIANGGKLEEWLINK